MASRTITLSDVLEKLIRRLCLGDFPCGCGSWKKNAREVTEATEMPSEESELLELLRCPHSPWRSDALWSPEAAALRRLAVVSSKPLADAFVYNYFKKLRIVDKHVSTIDDGLLKFSKLEQLILSTNKISHIPVDNLPKSLRVLDLRANLLSDLSSLSRSTPPHLYYLGLGSNSLGSSDDMKYFTKDLWPQVVCLDLGDCEFMAQQELLKHLCSLPRLKCLMLQGNPFTLSPSYPGLTIDSLPHLSILDALQILPETRQRFKGLAQRAGPMTDLASVTVCVGTMRDLPDPMMDVEEDAPEFPVISYSNYVTYNFFNDGTTAEPDQEPGVETAAEEEENQQPIDTFEEPCRLSTNVSPHRTEKLAWAESMDLSDTKTYTISDLSGFKMFLKQRLVLEIVQEKIESWPATPEEVAASKQGKPGGKEASKAPKDKQKGRKASAIDLVPGPPITSVLCSIQIPLHDLLGGTQNIDTICDFGILDPEPNEEKKEEKEEEEGEEEGPEKPEPEIKEEAKKSKKKGKAEKPEKKNAAKGKQKGRKDAVEAPAEDSVPEEVKPVTVEFSVELRRWRSASEATVDPTETLFCG